MTLHEHAAALIAKGLRVVPLKPGTKEPYVTDWNEGAGADMIFTPEDFGPDDNLGIRSIDGVVVVDVDAPEAVAVADAFLPRTGLIYGRPSKPRSKRLYLSTFEKIIALKDATGQTIIEIRSHHQDMAPPSIHPSGEACAWDVCGEIASAESESLLRAARVAATTVLVIKSYAAEGARHDWGLAWWGTLRHLGLTEPEVTAIAQEAGRVARDNKVPDRVTEVRSTFARAEDAPIKSESALKDQTSDEVVTALKDLWDLHGRNVHGFLMTGTGDKAHVDTRKAANIEHALMKLPVRVSFNQFTNKHIVYGPADDQVRPISDVVDRDLFLAIEDRFHWLPARELFTDVLLRMGDRDPFHPVRDYLTALKWDQQPRLDRWLIDYAGADDNPYTRAVSSLPLIAAVRRVMRFPRSTKFDEMLVLESGQGLGKSTAMKALCPFEEWFSDNLPLNADAKIILERTAGKWIVEAADLGGMHHSDIELLKASLSREVDESRMAYGRHVDSRARQFIIIGTTNSHHYLKDQTGNRRFWPLRVQPMSEETIAKLTEARDQLWAEAFARHQNKESIRLPEHLWAHAGVQQERRREIDPFEDHLAGQYGTEPDEQEDLRLTNDQVWIALGVIDVAKRTPREQKRLSGAMQKLGFTRLNSMRITRPDGAPAVMRGWERKAKNPRLPLEGVKL